MDLDQELEDSIKYLEQVTEELNRNIDAKQEADWDALFNAKTEAEARYERAIVAKGWAPAWPPITSEGRERWGVTEADVERINLEIQHRLRS